VPDDLGFKWTFVGPKGPTTDLQTWIDVGNKGCWEDNLDRIERVTAQWEFWKDVTWGLTPFLGTYAAFDEGDYMIGALSLVGDATLVVSLVSASGKLVRLACALDVGVGAVTGVMAYDSYR